MKLPVKAFCVAVASVSIGFGLYLYKFDLNPPEKRTEVYALTERNFIDVLSEFSLEYKDIPQDNIDPNDDGDCRTGLTFLDTKKMEIYKKMQKEDRLKTVPHEMIHGYIALSGINELNAKSYERDVDRYSNRLYHQVYGGR